MCRMRCLKPIKTVCQNCGVDAQEHYYSEFARAEKGAELWRHGDLEGYGQLVFESGKSSIYSYECGCDETEKS